LKGPGSRLCSIGKEQQSNQAQPKGVDVSSQIELSIDELLQEPRQNPKTFKF